MWPDFHLLFIVRSEREDINRAKTVKQLGDLEKSQQNTRFERTGQMQVNSTSQWRPSADLGQGPTQPLQ